MATKNLTITDIARMAGVSKTTVSRYLNGKYEYMSEPTRERISAVIDLVGYQPNNIARSLKSQKSMLVGLVIADIESPFSSAAIKSVGDAMLGTGYNIITANCDNSFQKEQDYIQSLMSQQVDGLIVNTTSMNNPLLISLANSGVPIVLLDRFVKDYKFDIAFIANREPILSAIDHLLEMGYSRVALFTESYEHISPRNIRREVFVEKLNAMGISQSEHYVHVVDNSRQQSVCDSIQSLLDKCKGESTPPAIIASNGVTLMHLAKAIESMGLTMPQDIGLCGYDDWGWASELGWAGMINVGLTTVAPSIHALGKLTAKALLRRMENPESEKQEIAVEAPLHIRQSTMLRR